MATGKEHRVGNGAAAFVLGVELTPQEKIPLTREAFGFGLLATESYIGTLKATAELFTSIKF